MDRLLSSKHASQIPIESTHAIELRLEDGHWRFQIFERGTELWHAAEDGSLLDDENLPITCQWHAIDGAAFRLAGCVRDVDAILQVVGFDTVLRADGSMRLEAPGTGEMRDERQGDALVPLAPPLLVTVNLGAATPPGAPLRNDALCFTARAEPGMVISVPRQGPEKVRLAV